MMKHATMVTAALLALLASGQALAAAASDKEDEGQSRTVQGKNDIEGEIVGSSAKDSPFAKLEIGMTQDQVSDLVGAGEECGAYQTGKAWIPFRFSSNDVMRSECNYKGVGRLVFTQSKRESYLLKIVNDAGEDGVRD